MGELLRVSRAPATLGTCRTGHWRDLSPEVACRMRGHMLESFFEGGHCRRRPVWADHVERVADSVSTASGTPVPTTGSASVSRCSPHGCALAFGGAALETNRGGSLHGRFTMHRIGLHEICAERRSTDRIPAGGETTRRGAGSCGSR